MPENVRSQSFGLSAGDRQRRSAFVTSFSDLRQAWEEAALSMDFVSAEVPDGTLPELRDRLTKRKRSTCRRELPSRETASGTSHPVDTPMILFGDVVQVFDLVRQRSCSLAVSMVKVPSNVLAKLSSLATNP
jgi:hypothetical protein